MSASPVVKTGEEAKYHLIQKNISKVGLGEGAKLGAAVCVTGSTGYMTIPAMVAGKERVIILQWFGAATTDYVTPVTANFPIAFPNECMIPLFSDVSTGAVDLSSTAAYSLAVGRSYYKIGRASCRERV